MVAKGFRERLCDKRATQEILVTELLFVFSGAHHIWYNYIEINTATYTHMYTNEYMQNWWNLNKVDGRYQFFFVLLIMQIYVIDGNWMKGIKDLSFCIFSYNCMWSVISENFIYLLYMPVCIYFTYKCMYTYTHRDMYVKVESVSHSVQLFETPMDYSKPGFSVHGILQVGIRDWVAILSTGSSRTKNWTPVSFITDSLPSEPPGKPIYMYVLYVCMCCA